MSSDELSDEGDESVQLMSHLYPEYFHYPPNFFDEESESEEHEEPESEEPDSPEVEPYQEPEYEVFDYEVHEEQEPEYEAPQESEDDKEESDDMNVDYEFVDQLTEDQICSICMHVLNQPHTINCCEQQYCQECLVKWLKKKKTCPHCRSTDYSHMLMKQKSRKLGELKVYCPNKKHGCLAILKMKDCDNHLTKTNDEGCQYVQLRCPNQCKFKVCRGDMKKHVTEDCPRRQVSCSYCAESGEHQYITESHLKSCTSYPVACPQKCGANISRKDLKAHSNTCPLEIVSCPYGELGCEDQVCRKDLEKHMESNILQHTTELAKSLIAVKESCRAIGEVLKTLPASLSDTPQVAQIQTLLSDTSEAEFEKPLYLTLSESNLSAGQHFFKLDKAIFRLQWEQMKGHSCESKYKFALSLKQQGEFRLCDVDVSISPYSEEACYAKLAQVCCQSFSSDKSFEFVGSAECSCETADSLQIGILFQKHNLLQCSCTQCSHASPLLFNLFANWPSLFTSVDDC